MEVAVAALEAKLVQLNMAKNRTANILKANDCEKIERQQGTLKDLVSETNKCKNTVEELKVVAKVSVEEIEAWNATVEDRGVTRALIEGVYIHIFVFCPTDFF